MAGRGPFGDSLFYRVLLPAGMVTNLALGLLVLIGLGPTRWTEWLEVFTGAVCCLVAGWLAAAAWSRSYWSHGLARRAETWRSISEAFLGWVEEAQLPPEALAGLKAKLDKALLKTKE